MHLFNFHISGQDAVVSHFDFDTYPDLNSVLSAEPAQPKLTGAASVIRYSILFSDLVCSIARVSAVLSTTAATTTTDMSITPMYWVLYSLA